MKIELKTYISCPIDDVWAIAADDFTGIQRWSESVVTSEALRDLDAVGESPMAGRYCTFTDDPDGFAARETITHYDKANHVLKFDVVPVHAPKALPLHKNQVELSLRALGPSETELRWVVVPDLKPHGYLLYPMLKFGLAKSFRGILAELKQYAEQQHSTVQLGATG